MLNDMLKYNLKNASLMLLALALFASCSKDDGASSKIELFSFGPSGVKHGDQIKFIGQNLDKVTSIILPPNVEIQASSFTSKTSTLIELVVPEEAEAGKVTLKTPQGDIVTKSMLSFLVPVEITSITAEAKPGTDISIKGSLVNWIESVTFNDGLKVTDFVSKTLDEVVVTVPMEAKTGFLVFVTGGTKPLSFSSVDQLIVTLPTVSALTPESIKHTENLTITGTDLDLVTSVAFQGGAVVQASDFVSQSLTDIVVAVPATTTNGKLTLTVPSGVEVVTDQTITIILPNVTALSPSDPSAQIAGATLTMTGTDLDLVASIKFPGVDAPITDFTKTSTQIDVVIPNGVMGGTIILTTIHDFTVPVTVAFGNQLTLLATIFDDAPHSPFGKGGGWGAGGSSTDIANTENPRVGTKSVKVTYGGDWGGGCQFGSWGNSPLSTSGTSYFAFSIYGGTGTGGKNINVNVSGTQKQISIDEGKWKDVKILLSDVGSPASISEVWFQDTGWSGTVYIDQIGLK
jgi:hypothetical protein